MKALVFEGPMRLHVTEVDDPSPAQDEVLLDVLAAGICGSDVHGYAGDTGRRVPGMVMGHEVVARVAALGSDVESVTVGDVVTVNPVIGCGRCALCAVGNTNLCPDRVVIGVTPEADGGFAERMVAPAANAHQVSRSGGMLVEPLAVALNVVRQVHVGKGMSVAVLGLGMIGLGCVWAALREGAATVVGVDLNPDKAELATHLGAQGVPLTTGLGDALHECGIDKVDVVIDAVGIHKTISDALSCVRGGIVGLVGMGSPDLRLSAYDLVTSERRLVGSFCYSQQVFAECAQAMDGVVAETFIEERITLDDAPDVFAELASGARDTVKIVIEPSQM